MGVAAIKGLQGENDMIDRHHVLAIAKHYAALAILFAAVMDDRLHSLVA